MKHKLKLHAEYPIPFSEVPALLPRRRGKKVHYCTVYRWATKGVRGRILRSQLVGGTRYTTVKALNEFFENETVKPPSNLEEKAIEQALFGKDKHNHGNEKRNFEPRRDNQPDK